MRSKDEVMRLLHQLFSNQDDLDRWLDNPNSSFSDRTPRSVMEEDGGADVVFTLIDLIFNGGGGL